jgi:exopolysaccharide biosynthesis WecB/TagA/CpsF family protein
MIAVPVAKAPSAAHLLLARSIDVLIALLLLVPLLPVLALRWMAGCLQTGRWLATETVLGQGGRPVRLLSFTGSLPGAHLARLLNLLGGQLTLGGPRPRPVTEAAVAPGATAVRGHLRPGLIDHLAPRAMMGLATGCELEADREFCTRYTALSGLKVTARWTVARALGGPSDRPTPSRLSILGVSLANTTMARAVDWIATRAASGERSLVAFANPHCLNIAHGYEPYRRVLRRADRVFADGIGVRIGARILGQRMADNVNGTDLFPLLCAAAAERGLKLFLLGARPGLATKTAEAMIARYPSLQVVGTRDGYFPAAQTGAVIREINHSGADILLVAMGAPQQEMWLSRHGAELTPAVRLAVGGLFDYYSGRIARAPVWMRDTGLEWVWRLIQEPRRLAYRYLVGNGAFVLRVLRERLMGTRAPTAHALHADGRWSQLRARLRTTLRRHQPQLSERTLNLAKRALDVTASGLGILALAPVFAIVAAWIRLESPGGVIFRQKRVGRDGQPFHMLKFRSMYVDAEARKAALMAQNEMAGGVIFKMKNDPRVTRIGRFIRRTSIDELPQLFNVLRGDMSLVGPRPPLPSEVAEYSLKDRGRLGAVPGITCIWQVSGRSEIPFPQQVEMDLDYIQHQSFTKDVRLLLKTVPALLRGRGAY